MSSALLVVDVQEYFVTQNAESVPQKIAWHIKESKYDHVLFVGFKNLPQSNFYKLLNFTRVSDAPDTNIHEALRPFLTPENTFEKNTYSAFKSESLKQYLETHYVTELDICGISLDACVLATAFEAFDLGYQVNVLDNLSGVSSVRDGLTEAAVTIINRNLRRSPVR